MHKSRLSNHKEWIITFKPGDTSPNSSPCWSTEGLPLLINECKEVCIEKCETRGFTQFGQCTIAESYMDSSTPPGNSIVLRFCSNCVNLAFNCVCPPTSTSICTRREKVWNVHRSVSTCQVIVLWMHLTHTEVQEFFVTEIFQKSCCAIAFDFWSRPKNWHLCHHTDSSYGWDLDTKLFSNIVRSYALCTYSSSQLHLL